MTTTLRPAGPLQNAGDGTTSRSYEVCVNSRPVGSVELGTEAAFGPTSGVIRSLRIDEKDRRRGRATVAALAAEEVLRGWGCTQVQASVPADAAPALRMAAALGYTEVSRNMCKELPQRPPALPAGVEARPMTEGEYEDWLLHAVGSYAQNWIDRGMSPGQARARSETGHREALPEGLATPGASMNVLVHEGSVVGRLWVGRREIRPGRTASYVYEVEVMESRRGKGFGRALMLLAERIALESGTPLLALHVFADNTPAVRLYASLGYATTHHNFFKQLW
jgi:ribosomal protein S18 acetylase RimI-like enzyme